ncbi:MAG TPA: hypothetical protein DCM87_01535 [Planctomycetes bacterium]|nr:hypothetical protein [Planctomycetota bacterium]
MVANHGLQALRFVPVTFVIAACLAAAAGCDTRTAPAAPPAAAPAPAAAAVPAAPQPSAPAAAALASTAAEEQALRDEQRREADRLAAMFPQSDDALYLAGLVCNEQGDWRAATAYWEKALALDPSRADTCNNLGYAFAIREDFARAEALFRKAIAIDPSFAEPYEQLGELLVKQGKLDDAVALLASIPAPTAKTARFLGQAYQHLRDYANAKRRYEAAIKLKPDYREVYYSLATVCARLGEREAAEAYRAKFNGMADETQERGRRVRSSLNVLGITKQSTAKTHTDVGRVMTAMGKADEAERLWRRAAAIDPANVESRIFLAAACLRAGRPAEAIARYRELAAIEPENGAHFFNLGALYLRLGQADAAQPVLERLTALAPDNPEAYAALAQARAMTGDVPGALAAIEHAMALDPANVRYRQFHETLNARK